MKNEKLYKNFSEAVQFVNNYEGQLPADVKLKLYAFYKIANENKNHPGSKTPLINAFKANALIQAKNLSRKEAMTAYVKLAKSLR
ncbi:acyl-CoA-binding protein [Aggregatimonas sangjinii]|uniref:Acyl-CoA-binding protein n=1 Tax=Aggregatimonas sangjinii TaxID=2583587 RepID=A0A5B7SM67_9FLAO|nr:acyl-CoA-binding protein [Aggregatimonas sangjinii]QCW99181.1 acyl-CoA-binding protein [Aggregatimonas sangjinii]